jgi:hypothetical protein
LEEGWKKGRRKGWRKRFRKWKEAKRKERVAEEGGGRGGR